MHTLSATEAAAATAGLIKALETAGMPAKDAPVASVVITTAILVAAQIPLAHPAYVMGGLNGLLVGAAAAGSLTVVYRGKSLAGTAKAKVQAKVAASKAKKQAARVATVPPPPATS